MANDLGLISVFRIGRPIIEYLSLEHSKYMLPCLSDILSLQNLSYQHHRLSMNSLCRLLTVLILRFFHTSQFGMLIQESDDDSDESKPRKDSVQRSKHVAKGAAITPFTEIQVNNPSVDASEYHNDYGRY